MRLKNQVITATTAIMLLLASVSTFAKTYVHDMGEVTINKVPQRVVVLGFASLDFINTLGIDPVGLPKSPLPPYLNKFAAEKYTNTGTPMEVNYETLFSLKPDLIIAEGRMMKRYKDLAEIAPTYLFNIDTNNYWETTQKHWQTLAQIFNKEEQVNQLISEIQTKITALKSKVSETKPKTLTVMNNGNNVSMFGPASRFSFIYQEAGFASSRSQNIKSKPRPHGDLISFEYIADAQPEVLLIMDREQAIGKSTGKAQALFNNELVNSTPAAKDNHVIFLDPVAWYLSSGGYQSTVAMIDDLNKAISK